MGDSEGLGRLERPWIQWKERVQEEERVGDCEGLGRLERPWRPGEV